MGKEKEYWTFGDPANKDFRLIINISNIIVCVDKTVPEEEIEGVKEKVSAALRNHLSDAELKERAVAQDVETYRLPISPYSARNPTHAEARKRIESLGIPGVYVSEKERWGPDSE